MATNNAGKIRGTPKQRVPAKKKGGTTVGVGEAKVNPFQGLADSLSTDQLKQLLEALGVREPEEVPEYKVVAPAKKTAVKKVAKKAPAKKATKKVVAGKPARKKPGPRPPETFITTIKQGETTSRRQKVKFKANEWKDDGSCRNAKTKMKKGLVPTERVRPETKEVTHTCYICGRPYKTSSAFENEFRTVKRCDRCTG